MIIQVFTQTGLDWKAANFAASTPQGVAKIRAITSSSGFVTTTAAAVALTAMPADAEANRVDVDSPFGRYSGNVAQYGFVGTGTGTYLIYSYGLFNAADQLIGYICDDAGASIGSKTGSTAALASLTVEFTNGDTSGLAENNYVLIPPGTDDLVGGFTAASQADINAGRGKGAVIGERLGAWWTQLSIPVSKIQGLTSALGGYVTLTYLAGVLRIKADVDSETLTGTPRSTTPPATDSSTRIATTAFVNSWYADTIHVSTSDPTSTDGSRGDIWLKREA